MEEMTISDGREEKGSKERTMWKERGRQRKGENELNLSKGKGSEERNVRKERRQMKKR